MNTINKFLTLQDIENLDKNSDIIYLKALYQCESIVCLDENQAPLYANNTNEFYTYQSSFYLSFCDREKISDEYLEARKALYKTYQAIKKQKSQDILLLLDKEQKNQNKSKLDKDEHKLKTGDQQSSIIFLDTQDSLSNLIHIHSNKCDIFTKSGTLFNIEDLQKQYALDFSSYQTQIFLYSTLLTGDSETSTPLYFGKVDSEGRFEPLSPTYVLNDLGEGKAHLKVFLDNQSLILYNYSLSENSLGVKLDCKSEESKEMREKDKERVEKEKAQKEALMITPSLSAFTPIIEDDTLMCSHGGSVKLQSQKGKKFKSKGVPLILESDLANSSISGCPNPPLSGGPCTKIALIPPLALSVKKFNGEGAPLQEYASMIMTDKGVPLMCIPKPNQFKVFQPANPQGSGESAKEIVANIKLEKPKLRLHLKECLYQKDNLIVTRYVFEGKENILEEPLKQLEIRNLEEVKNEKMKAILSKDYENYSLKQSTLQIGMHLITMIFIIPTKIPKIFKNALEEYEDKDYGVGSFKELTQYQQDFKKDNINHHYRTFIAPAKLTKIDLEFAVGLDNFLPYNSSSFIITTEELDDE